MILPPRRQSLRAFSLTELLVVVSALVILMMITLPAITTMKESAVRLTCLSNLRQIGIGFVTYAVDFRGQVPLTMPNDWLQSNYYLCAPNPLGDRVVTGIGLIANMAELPPKVLYCPVRNPFNPYQAYNSALNPAPDPFYPIPTTNTLRAGYAVCWGVAWNAPLPRSALVLNAQTALVTDLCHLRAVMPFRHQVGANAVCGDGHGKFVKWNDIRPEYDGIPFSTMNKSYDPQLQNYYTALARN